MGSLLGCPAPQQAGNGPLVVSHENPAILSARRKNICVLRRAEEASLPVGDMRHIQVRATAMHCGYCRLFDVAIKQKSHFRILGLVLPSLSFGWPARQAESCNSIHRRLAAAVSMSTW